MQPGKSRNNNKYKSADRNLAIGISNLLRSEAPMKICTNSIQKKQKNVNYENDSYENGK